MAIDRANEGFQQRPQVLIVPELAEQERPRWQAGWAKRRRDVRLLELGGWDEPHRNTWVNKLNLAIYRAGRPVVLVAQGLSSVAVAWWAEYERPSFGNPVAGALLVGPPDLDRPGSDARLARFGSCPRKPLPFPAFLVASGKGRDDPARQLARDWGCRFVDPPGTARSAPDTVPNGWSFGEALLRRLLGERSTGGRLASEDMPPVVAGLPG